MNGTFFQVSDDAGPLIQTGTVSFEVNAGDEFGFSQQTVDGQFGFGRTRITSFRAPVPGPISALAVLPLAGMAAYRRRFKGLIKLS